MSKMLDLSNDFLSWFKFKLRNSIPNMISRCLNLSSKFVSEQLFSIIELENTTEFNIAFTSSENEGTSHSDRDLSLYSSSLILQYEYQRVAFMIRSIKGRELFSTKVNPTKTLKELRFLASYSLYMVE